MAKKKGRNGEGPRRGHLHSRVSYLYQAARYLSTHQTPPQPCPDIWTNPSQSAVPRADLGHYPLAASEKSEQLGERAASAVSPSTGLSLARRFLSHMWDISLKSQMRLPSDVKRCMCRRCRAPLIVPSTAVVRLENRSRGGRKAWADVLVTRCVACGAEKRIPTGAKRQARKKDRVRAGSAIESTALVTAGRGKEAQGQIATLPPRDAGVASS